MKKTSLFLTVVLMLAGCNLTTTPPTPTLAPTQPPTLEPLVPIESPTDNTPINPDCPATPSDWLAYTVEVGDSLSLLAEQTGSTIGDLIAGNCLENPDAIYVDFVIYLPRIPAVAP
ncbi:MAG TPA: LysM peptidoglycan-binding domain-containing protein [Phototrophicaceae bacterium]|nr:LysM peptidoglycan-binding domain-containing protein [Phototrophicaceae bacterium]